MAPGQTPRDPTAGAGKSMVLSRNNVARVPSLNAPRVFGLPCEAPEPLRGLNLISTIDVLCGRGSDSITADQFHLMYIKGYKPIFFAQAAAAAAITLRRLRIRLTILIRTHPCVGFGVGCWLVFAYVSFPSAITGTLDLEPYQQILVTYDPSKYTAYSVMGAEGTVIYKFTEAPPSLIGTCVNSTDTFTFVLGQDKYEYYGYYLTIGTTVDFSWHFDSSLYFDVYLKDETMYSSHGRTGSGRVTAQQDGEYIFQVENSYVTAYSNTGYYTLTITRPEVSCQRRQCQCSAGSPKYQLTLQLDVSRVWFWVAIGLFIVLIPLGLCVLMIPLKYLRRLETLEELVAVLQYDLQRAQTIILTLVAQVDKMTRPRQDGSETASHFFSMPSSPENTDPSPPIVCIPIDYPYFSCINDVAGWSISSAMHYRAASSSGYSECWFSSCYSTAVITCLGAPAASQTDFHSPPARPSPSDPSPPLTSPISTPDTSSFFQQLMMQGTASTLVPTPRPHAATNDLAAPPPQISPASGAPEPEAQQPGGEESTLGAPVPGLPPVLGRRHPFALRIPSPNRSALPSVQPVVTALAWIGFAIWNHLGIFALPSWCGLLFCSF
ncbi:hypothetical protein PAPYR_5751 [Paratrimastix pyriformis]|uniref:GOLD domain-containing protein n=1 Tax=Paratrimastix pyriformis TaxID=342808 RepID=A0ABQ8UKS4_9EUKA|nr:hypothetical protein PAPYR_5751 [Paratrimastix pyriformis]